MRVPGFMLRLRFGGVASLITTGQRVVPRRALALGFAFQFPDIDGALQDVLKR
jgi:NAD dependent epimerase/dehydratase family enzyme